MTFGAEIWGPALLSAAGSLGGGFLAGQSSGRETKTQRQQRKLVDQLISSLGGEGPYADLYNADEAAFQKSFVDPALSRFRNQIAPQIRQQYIATGQQRGSALDDELMRAGVDLDQLLNQYMSQYQQGAQNRKQNAISSILGQGAGGTQDLGIGQSLAQAGAGYLSSPAFSNALSGLYKQPQQQTNMINPFAPPPRKGFEPDFGLPNFQYSYSRGGL